MRVLVCGGRDFILKEVAYAVLDRVHADRPIDLVIEGGASGADTLAHLWAFDHGVPSQKFRAGWRVHGKAAGPMRNQAMIDEGKPDLVVAFPGGAGTADMVRRAEKAGVPVERVN